MNNQAKLQLRKELDSIDNLIAIYSTMDMVRVAQLVSNKVALERILLDVMDQENEVYLASIRKSN
jgi:hypothetical protein